MKQENLHLVDFNNLSLDEIKTQIENALTKGLEFLQKLEINICENSEQALQDITDFEFVGLALDRFWGILSHLNSVVSNDEIRHLHHEILPKLSEYSTKVGQHQPLFSRYRQIVDDKAFFDNLPQARKRALRLALQGFELSGVALPDDKKAEFAKLSSELSLLSAKFSDNVLDATQSYFLPLTENQLQGLPTSALTMLQEVGERYRQKFEKSTPTDYVATLDIPVYLAVMTYADDRKLRETLYQAYVTRASEQSERVEFNNAEIIEQILAKRQQKANLLGFDKYAELSLASKMADNVAEVERFLTDLADKAMPSAKADLQILQDEAKAFGIDEIKAWDTAYLAEKVRERKFNLSQEAQRPYFPLPKVIDGLFEIVKRLYRIDIVEKTAEVARWHDDVRFYELYDDNQALIGGFYFDLYARTGKRGGAWMSGFQSRYENLDKNYQQLPVCFMVGNFTPAVGDKPSLLTHDEVLTLFHEFGHGLHHLLTEVSIADVAGVNGVEWDAVELPSQFMENWAWHADGIALISSHVETGETLPTQMLNAMLNAKNFQSGMQTLRQLEFALFDLRLHASKVPDYQGVLALLDNVRQQVAIMPATDYNRFANSFSHIFAGGYACGYYSYKWAELLSADAFDKFEQDGIFNAETGKQFKLEILAKGGSRSAKENFEAFRQRPANIEALLRHSGFKQ